MEQLTLDELKEINRALSNRFSVLSQRWNEASGEEVDELEEQLAITHQTRTKVRSMIKHIEKMQDIYKNL